MQDSQEKSKIQKYPVEDCFRLRIGQLDLSCLHKCLKSGNLKCRELETIVIKPRGLDVLYLRYRFIIKDGTLSVFLIFKNNPESHEIRQMVKLEPLRTRFDCRWYFNINGKQLSVLYLRPGCSYWGHRANLNLVYHLQTINPKGPHGKMAKMLHWDMKLRDLQTEIRRESYANRQTSKVRRYVELVKNHSYI
jgi:hypothetical protein